MEPPVLDPTASHPLWQHQFDLLLESTGEGIFGIGIGIGIDLDGHCMFINRAGARMLGHEAREVLGSNMHELTHHSHPDGSHYADTDCPIFNAFRRGLPCRIDIEVFRRRDDSAFAVEYSSHPIMDGAQMRGAVITFVDITERRRQAEALQQAKDELGVRVEQRTRELSDALVHLREPVWPMLLNTAFGVASVKREWLALASRLEMKPLRRALRVFCPRRRRPSSRACASA